MKKSLIALAVAGMFVAPAAMADVTIYGVASLSVDQTKTGGNNSATNNLVSSNQSRIGFKGTEDLSGGLSAVWQIEQTVTMDTGGGTFGTRNTFVGLKSDSIGTGLLGRHDTPYKLSTRGYDVFADTMADNRNIMGKTGGSIGTTTSHDARESNVFAYVSPAFNNFTVVAAIVAAAETSTSTQSKANAHSLAALYNAGPISVSAAYQKENGGSSCTLTDIACVGSAGNAKAWKVGGGYTMDAFKVNAVYEKTSGNLTAGGNELDQKNYYLAGTFAATANDTVKLSYTKASDEGAASGTTANTGAKQWALGVDHSMSKRTSVYALYTKLSNDSAAAYGVGTGVAGGAVAASAVDADPSAFSFGLKHSF